MKFLSLVLFLALSPAFAGPVVNDVTQINPIEVDRVETPTSTEQIQALLREFKGPVSIGGARHSMGGQIASERTLHLDMRSMDKVLAFDPGKKEITVQAGITWRKIQELVDSKGLAVKIMLPKCTKCHSWAGAKLGMIAFRVQSKDPSFKMPKPGSPDLTPSERALLLEWIKRGGPQGGEDHPTPPENPTTHPIAATFATVKATVIDQKCLRCHKKDFDTFAHTRPLLREIDFRVKAIGTKDQMPPAAKPQLSEIEKKLLLDWIQAGAPEN